MSKRPKKKLSFTFYPEDEKEFVKAEAALRQYIAGNKPIPPKVASRFLELLYSSQNLNADITEKYLHAIKKEAVNHFKDKRAYFFKVEHDGNEYSLENWLDIVLDTLKENPIEQRKDFILFIVESLSAYIRVLQKPPISTKGIYIVTGFITAMFAGDIFSPSEYPEDRYSYKDYNDYLYFTIRSVVEG